MNFLAAKVETNYAKIHSKTICKHVMSYLRDTISQESVGVGVKIFATISKIPISSFSWHRSELMITHVYAADPHILWKKQIAQIKMRLNHTTGMLSKLWINAYILKCIHNAYILNILKTAYHSLFESHLQYGTQLWGQKSNETITTFQKLQNHVLRKITFKKYHDSISCVYKECKILKFLDILNLQNCLFMY